uniref:H(+)-exporting diphosphatase n=1 Tax=Calcidiscus leptoporus TaxID=127549 RepID=A0A7S0P118_9EUKA|mmetsp:Transcript_43093/g.100987  ORF Transcript_43093/g.100987 Transcript_43093/m.100987 type:complete len:223 (+) Transcript_43093:171-839(+)
MLAADKLLLQSNVKQRAIQLREKELNLFNDNFNAVGTQSAVLAGFAMTSFAEIDLPHNAFYAQKACLHLFVTVSICANLLCTASTTFVSVWGSGKALRGKDGSMDKAVDGMLAERAFIFACFGVGLITTLMALMSAAWILMTRDVAFVATIGIAWCIYVITRQARRIHGKFKLSKGDVVTFDDIMQSPVVPLSNNKDDDEEDETDLLMPRSTQGARTRSYDV